MYIHPWFRIDNDAERVLSIDDFISIRIAIGSGTAFLVAQLVDVNIFHKLRKKIWFTAPLVSSLIGSTIDTFLFFSISFYGTGFNWLTLSFGDLFVKIFVAFLMLIPFKILLYRVKEISETKKKLKELKKKIFQINENFDISESRLIHFVTYIIKKHVLQ